MTQIQIDIDDEKINKQIELYQVINCLAAKTIAVEEIIRAYFKEHPINIK